MTPAELLAQASQPIYVRIRRDKERVEGRALAMLECLEAHVFNRDCNVNFIKRNRMKQLPAEDPLIHARKMLARGRSNIVTKSDNRELEDLRREQKAKQPRGRFVALRWVLKASYHDSEDEARQALATTRTAIERVAIVDRDTGNSLTRQGLLWSVMRHLKKVEKSAPRRFRRVGTIGPLPKPKGRKR